MVPPLPPAREGHDFPGLRTVGVDKTPRTGNFFFQGGSWSGHHAFRGLKWGQDNLELPWKTNLVDIGVKGRVGGRRPDPPQQAETVTMGMIECLEIFIADPTTSMVAKHLAAAYLFCCYVVMRVEQAQECWIDTVRDDEFIEGYVCLDKNPVRSKMQPRPFWSPSYGITNSKLYFTILLDSLKDVTDKCYIFGAYKSPDGSVKNATGFLPGPLLQSHGLMNAIQEVLQTACGFSVEQSQAYTLHSPRHFLPDSTEYQRHGVSPAPASAKLVDGVTVWLNYPLLDQRPTCCENTEQGLQPFLICTRKTTLHSVLWLFSEDK